MSKPTLFIGSSTESKHRCVYESSVHSSYPPGFALIDHNAPTDNAGRGVTLQSTEPDNTTSTVCFDLGVLKMISAPAGQVMTHL